GGDGDRLPVDLAEGQLDAGVLILTQVGANRIPEAQLEAVAVALRTEALEVLIEPENLAVVRDADQERASLAVHEGGERLGYYLRERLVHLIFTVVPAKRGLVLDAEALAAGDQVFNSRERLRLLGDQALHELVDPLGDQPPPLGQEILEALNAPE